MLEIKVNIEAPSLETAILKLAESIGSIAVVTESQLEETTEAPTLAFMPEDVEKVEVEAPQPVEAVKEPEPVAEAKPSVTRNDLFARCSALVQGKKIEMQAMAGILGKFSVKSLPELSEEQVQLFWNELDAMGV